MRVLMTGLTGFLGRFLGEALLERFADLELFALVRTPSGSAPGERPEIASLAKDPRVHLFAADLSRLDLGLAPNSHGNGRSGVLPDAFDACFHLAAETEFRERLREQTFRTNLDGTRHLIGFLERLTRPPKFYHVSTAYVCGAVPGLSPETLLGPRPFINPYEESKHAAEAAVATSRLDWSILRPSILMGDSQTGDATTDKMTYGVFRTYWRLREILRNKYADDALRGLAPGCFAVESDPAVTKNLICIDDVVRLMLRLFERTPAAGTIFHLSNPRPARLDAINAAAFDVLEMRCLRLTTKMPENLCAEERLVRRGLDVYRAYLTREEAHFEQAALRAAIGDAAVDAILPMTHERLAFLYGAYLRREQERAPGPQGRAGMVRLASQPVLSPACAGSEPLPTDAANAAAASGVAALPETIASAPDPRLGHIRRHGRGPLAYLSLTNGTSALFLPDGRGFIGYAIKGRTCAMVGDSLCALVDTASAVKAFLAFCEEHRLDPVAVQVGGSVGETLLAHGGHLNRMGDEAIVDLTRFDLSLPGSSNWHFRQTRNRAVNHGVTVREITYRDVPLEQIERVSQTWLARKINQRELSTLLRPLPRADEPDVRKFAAFQNGEVVGIVVFNPLYRPQQHSGRAGMVRLAAQPVLSPGLPPGSEPFSAEAAASGVAALTAQPAAASGVAAPPGAIFGYVADIERYAPKPYGIHDLILLEGIRAFQAEGRQVLSLGLAPLFHLEEPEHPSHSPTTRDMLLRIRDEATPVYNFHGVSHHKTYYLPRWEPQYLWTRHADAREQILDVFNLIGLLPPEALLAMSDETFERLQ